MKKNIKKDLSAWQQFKSLLIKLTTILYRSFYKKASNIIHFVIQVGYLNREIG